MPATQMKPMVSSVVGVLAILAIGGTAWGSDPKLLPTSRPSSAVPPQLLKKLPTVSFNAVRLDDVLDFMRDVGGMKIRVDWPELEKSGIKRNQPINFVAHDLAYDAVLRFVLWEAAGPGTLDVVTDGSELHVTTADKLKTPATGAVTWLMDQPAGESKLSGEPLMMLGIAEGGFCAWPDLMPIPAKGVRIDKAPLGLVLEVVRDLGVKNIWVDWTAIARTGITSETELTFLVPGKATASQLLDAFVAAAKGKQEIGYAVIDGVVVISTKTEVQRLIGALALAPKR
jgi:hypothetical protein